MQVRLFSDSQQYSHRVRFVMALKKVSAKVDYVTGKSKELLDINSQGTLPTLEDRDVRLTESQVIIEYLDERYPYPQLMPGFPVQRAECRQQMYWIQKDLCAHADVIAEGSGPRVSKTRKEQANKARQELRTNLMILMQRFDNYVWFSGKDFSLVDCCMAPLLWRLPSLGINFQQSPRTLPLLRYSKRLFEMESFIPSLSEVERDMR